jgi:hypothetical protein
MNVRNNERLENIICSAKSCVSTCMDGLIFIIYQNIDTLEIENLSTTVAASLEAPSVGQLEHYDSKFESH